MSGFSLRGKIYTLGFCFSSRQFYCPIPLFRQHFYVNSRGFTFMSVGQDNKNAVCLSVCPSPCLHGASGRVRVALTHFADQPFLVRCCLLLYTYSYRVSRKCNDNKIYILFSNYNKFIYTVSAEENMNTTLTIKTRNMIRAKLTRKLNRSTAVKFSEVNNYEMFC